MKDVDIQPTTEMDGGLLKLIYQRDNSHTDLIYRAKTGPGLAGWTTSGVSDGVSGPPNPSGVETREASIPLAPDSGFLRLELELQP